MAEPANEPSEAAEVLSGAAGAFFAPGLAFALLLAPAAAAAKASASSSTPHLHTAGWQGERG